MYQWHGTGHLRYYIFFHQKEKFPFVDKRSLFPHHPRNLTICRGVASEIYFPFGPFICGTCSSSCIFHGPCAVQILFITINSHILRFKKSTTVSRCAVDIEDYSKNLTTSLKCLSNTEQPLQQKLCPDTKFSKEFDFDFFSRWTIFYCKRFVNPTYHQSIFYQIFLE